MRGSSIFVALAAISNVQLIAASTPDVLSEYCFYSVYESLASFTWKASSSGHRSGKFARSTKTTECNLVDEVTSLYASSKRYCSSDDFTAGLKYWKSLCKKTGLMDLSNISSTVTDEYIDQMTVIDPATASTKTALSSPVLLQQDYYEIAYKSYVIKGTATEKSTRIAWGIMGYWGGILVLGMLNNFANFVWHRRIRKPSKDSEGAQTNARNRGLLSHILRTYIIIPAAFGKHHQRLLMGCTIPKRLDLVIVLGFWAACVLCACVSYDAFPGNIVYPTVAEQVWVYMGPRLGILSFCCLPWIWLFAGRNNIFIWATGWNFRTFNIFHRHTARAMTIFGILHAISYTVKYKVYSPGKYAEDLVEQWFIMGIVSIVLFSVLLFFSMSWMRSRFYDLFLVIHIVFSLVALIAIFRFVRMVRLVYCNLHVYIQGNTLSPTSTSVTYNSADDVIEINIQRSSTLLRPAPGQYYHIYQPFTLPGWENHPFTLGSYTQSPQFQPSDRAEKLPVPETTHSSSESSEDPPPTTFTFWIRPYDGWTRRLRDACLRNPSPFQPTLLIEGPYGHREPLYTFDTVLLIVGGTGISAALPYILDHIARSNNGRLVTTQLQLMWTTKQASFMRRIWARNLASASQREDFEARFFCTGASFVEEVGEKGEGTDTDIRIRKGRPDVRDVILGAAREARDSRTSVAVLVCGPAVMADTARAAVATALREGCRGVEYVEDTFGW